MCMRYRLRSASSQAMIQVWEICYNSCTHPLLTRSLCCMQYLSGFGNENASEALPGALPKGQVSDLHGTCNFSNFPKP